PGWLAAEEDIFGHVQIVENIEFLVYEPDASVDRIGDRPDRNLMSFDSDLASVRLIDSAQNLHQSGLAGAVLSGESDDLSGADLEIHAIKRDHAREELGDRLHFKDGRCHSFSCSLTERRCVPGCARFQRACPDEGVPENTTNVLLG